MKNNYFFTLLLAAILPFIAACSDKGNNIVNPNIVNPGNSGNEEKPVLIYLENISDYWDNAIVKDQNNYVCQKNLENDDKLSVGYFEDKVVKMVSDPQARPTTIECDDFKTNISYRGGKALAFCQYKDLMYCDSLDIVETQTQPQAVKSTAATRATSQVNTDALAALIAWLLEHGIRDGLENVPTDNPVVNAILSLLDFQKETLDMGSLGELNYLIEKYNYADWVLQPSVETCPVDWLKEMLEESENNNVTEEEEAKAAASIIIGLVTGNAPYISTTSAKCLVDGYLQAAANDGSFDFNYGLCYSESPTPTISDHVLYKNIKSENQTGKTITLTLPEPFLLTNLQSKTTYYYRAYFKDNATNYVIYSEVIRSFTTSDIPASISSFAQTNSYHNENGFSNNGKTYSYKFMTTLKAELESFNNISDWGYYYINEEGERVDFSMMSRGSLRCDDVLEYYSQKAETTIKLGCYVKYKESDNTLYSDPQSYNLKYNDEVTLTFTDCNYITVTHDNSLGYYRCGVTFDVSFKVQGSQNLTSIVILPYGNFLSWNAPSYNNPSDGDYTTVITDQYLYEYGLYGNFYCYLYAKDISGKEYYSDNMVRLYHDGSHFTSCVVEPWEALSPKKAPSRKVQETRYIERH